MSGPLGVGPLSSQDNGDGTFSFQMPDGSVLHASGQTAAAKHDQLAQLNPAIANAAQPGPDMRTAEAEKGSFEVPGLTAPPPTATDAARPAPDAQTSAIVQNLNATAGIPQTVKLKAGAGNISPSELVGAGGSARRNDQIPTVVTGGTGGHVVPGHMALAQTSTSQTKVPEPVQREFGQASDTKLQGANQQEAAETEQAGKIAGIKGQLNQDLGAFGQNVNDAEARRQAYLNARMSRIDDANMRLQRMPDEHAPNIGIAGALAMALGAAGASLTGGPNAAMAILNKKMDMAIDARRANWAKAKGNVDAEKDAYGFAVKTMGDQRQAELSIKNKYIDDAVRKLDADTADSQSALIKARATAFRGALLEERAKNDAAFNKIEEHNSFQMTKPQVVGGSNSVPIHGDIKKEETVKGADGRLYEFGSGATAQKAAEQIGGLNQQLSDAQELSTIVGNPANLADPAQRSRADAISARMVEHAKDTEANGVKLSKEGIDLLTRARGGDPNALLAFGKSAGLQEYMAGVRSQNKGLIEQHAISEVEPYQEVNPRTGEATMRFVRKRRGPQKGPDVSDKRVGE